MKKAIIIFMIASLISLYANGVFASTARCKVTEITGMDVILDCGKGAAKIKVGDKVKVKTTKKAAVEGC